MCGELSDEDFFCTQACRHPTKRCALEDKDVMGNRIEIQTNVDSSLQVLREDQVKVEL